MDLPATEAEPELAALLAARPPLAMHAQSGLLFEDVPLHAIADALGTPAWVIGAGTLRARLARLRAALDGARLAAHIHYAVKANDHLAVLRVMAGAGAGADVVSLGEFLRARVAGIPAERIVFSGVGKTRAELLRAAAEGVGQVNVESPAELEMLAAVAAEAGRRVDVALRVNPDIAAGGHEKISTGRAADKFGIAADEVPALYARAASLPFLRPVGLAVHIGSQILAGGPFRAAYARVAALVRALRAEGLAVGRVDCGGGLGIAYRDEAAMLPEAWAGAIAAALGGLDLELMVEPGRWLAGPAGLLLASVVLEKRAAGRRVVVLDAGMGELIRPALYGAWHGILPLDAATLAAPASPADVVGPICESGDRFATARALPPLAAGARVALLDAGAYGAVMASAYNARPPAPVALVDEGRWTTVRARPAIETLWAGESVPDWLAA